MLSMMEVAARLRLTPVRAKRRKRPRIPKAKSLLHVRVHQQDHRCAYCKKRMIYESRHDSDKFNHPRRATLDHVVPLAAGGRNDAGNIVAACLECNTAKGSMTLDEFRAVREKMA